MTPNYRVSSLATTRRNLMKKSIGKVLAFALLLGCFVFVPSPQQTRADTWANCDADRTNRNDYCLAQYNQCVQSNIANNTNNDCEGPRNSCLDSSAKLHHDYTTSPPSGCLFENQTGPVPLPVYDDSRERCMQTCSDGASQISNQAEAQGPSGSQK